MSKKVKNDSKDKQELQTPEKFLSGIQNGK